MRKIKRKKQYIYCIFILVLCGSLPVSCQTVVYGELSKEVILLCSFKPGEDEVIHWYEDNNQKTKLHSYYHKQDHLEYQDSAYRGRTSLFLSEISKGNASLLIKNVNESDEKTYSCYVGTKVDRVECTVKLRITAFENPSIKYTKNGTRQFNCCANYSTPKDALRITWLQKDTIVGTGSEFQIQNNTDALQCVIHHTYLNRNWTGSWEMTELSSDGDTVKFECKLCQTIQQYFSVQWTMRTNSSETEVASMDSHNRTLQPNHNYKHRIEPDSSDCGSFYIKDLSKDDSGEYLCTTVEVNRMHIKVMSLTIIRVEEHRSWKRIVLILVPIIFPGIVCVICFKKKKSP